MQHNLPEIEGKYIFDCMLKGLAFLKVGGPCDVMFFPKNMKDLVTFLKNKPNDLKTLVLGNMSNTLILDGGIRGCVINLTNSDNCVKFIDEVAVVDAGLNLQEFIKKSVANNISSCEKLFGIPGTIGGAIIMNAGVSEFEISDVLISVDCVDTHGNKLTLTKDKLQITYRNGGIPKDLIVTSVTLKTFVKKKHELENTLNEINKRRLSTQPIGCATCGCTFKNPPGMKAWQLIKEAGCQKLTVNGAIISDIHCNFLINSGNANASDFVELIRIIKDKVLEKTGVILEEEIVIIGEEL